MSDNNDFWDAVGTENFQFVNHNDTDYEKFKKFQDEFDETFSKSEAKRELTERKANLAKWDKSLPGRWADAKLNLIEKPVIQRIKRALKDNSKGSYFLTGGSGVGKTFVAYAIVRRLIGMGIATPSVVKQISESVLNSWSSRGFRGQELLNELLGSQYKVYVFDGAGSLDEKERAKVAPLWEQIIEHIYANDLIAIFTSTDDAERFAEFLSPSGETKLLTLVDKRSFEVESEGSISPSARAPKERNTSSNKVSSKDGAWQ